MRNRAVSLKMIAAGDAIPVEVQGGFVRQAAPESGLLALDGEDREIYIPESLLQVAGWVKRG